MRRRRNTDADDVVQDGQSVRTRVTLMDHGRRINARDHQPHYASDTRARQAALDARDQYVRRLRDSWRTPGRDAAEPDLGARPEELMRSHLQTESSAEAQAKRDAAWSAYKDQVSRAWMMGRTDPQAATAVENLRRRWTAER